MAEISEELLAKLESDRKLIEAELPELNERNARMAEAAGEQTLCGNLRRAIHANQRSLRAIARDTGISPETLCDFLEGERTLRSDVLDRLAQAVRVNVTFESCSP